MPLFCHEQRNRQPFQYFLPPSLLRQLDEMSGEKGYDNRSLAIADMIRDRLVEHRQKFGNEDIAGTITLVYDHHKPHLQATLTDIQHDHHHVILSTCMCIWIIIIAWKYCSCVAKRPSSKKLPMNSSALKGSNTAS